MENQEIKQDLNQEVFSINGIIQEAFRVNQIESEDKDGWLNPKLTTPIQIDSAIRIINQEENAVLTRLDVAVRLPEPDRRVLVESFGDVGTDFEDATQKNWENFQSASLPNILRAFSDSPENAKYFDAIWRINGQEYFTYIGDTVIKANDTPPYLPPPEVFFDKLIQSLGDYTIGKRVHFLRIYLNQNQEKIDTLEVVLDNENLKYTEEDLLEIDWVKRPDFYSIRLFIILIPIENFEEFLKNNPPPTQEISENPENPETKSE